MTNSGEDKPGTHDALETSQVVCEVSRDRRLVRWNSAWQQLLNSASSHSMRQACDLEGDRFLDWVQLEDKPAVAEVFEQLEAGTQDMCSEFRLRGDGRELVKLKWTRLDAATDDETWIGIGHLKRGSRVDTCQQTTHLHATNLDPAPRDAKMSGAGNYKLDSVELAAFASRASHDIRAPLRAIHGLSKILHEDYADAIDEEGRDYLERVATAAQRLGKTVDGITEYLRLAGYGCSFRAVDLNEIIRVVAEDHQLDDAAASGKVVTESLPVVHGDPVQLLRLFHELVGNGIVHNSSTSPVVEVGVDHKEFRSELAVDSTRVVIGVSDNGSGVPEQHREEIFAAFRRLKPVGDASGLGLGLATSLRIVRRHGGNLRCLERQGSGSQFVFDLPLRREHSEDADHDAC